MGASRPNSETDAKYNRSCIISKPKKKNASAFAARLKSFMDEKGLTQQRVANDAEISQAAVHKWLNGASPRAEELFKFASANGVAVEWFLDAPKKELTECSPKSNIAGVSSEINKLIVRVKAKASKPGAKAELARTLDVDPARISEWLAGKKEPGGEYTLRLLHWVEQQECQK